MHTTITGSLVPADSSNFGPPDGSAPDLDRLGARSSTLEVKVNEILLRFATPAARTERFQIRPVTFRRLPTLWAYLRPRSQGLSKISAYIYIYQPVSSLWKVEMAPAQVSLAPQLVLGPCPVASVVPQLPGSATQIQWTTTGTCDENSKRTQTVKTRAVPFSYAAHVRKVVQTFPLGSQMKSQNLRKILKSNARAAACRLVLCLPPKRHDIKMRACNVQLTMLSSRTQPTILVGQSKSEEARDVGVHTLACCMHIFLHMARVQSHLHIVMRVHIHAWLKSCQNCTCVIPLHLAFSISRLTRLCCSRTVTSRPFPTSRSCPSSCQTFPS